MITVKLDAAIKAVCPIHGISIRRKDDKATWRIDFKDEATAQERASALAVLDAFDLAGSDSADAAIKARQRIDAEEAAQVRADAQVQADLDRTPQEIANAIDALFPTFSAQQRAFLRRVALMAQAAGRKALR